MKDVLKDINNFATNNKIFIPSDDEKVILIILLTIWNFKYVMLLTKTMKDLG